MADRVSASITIGGTLPSTLLPEFIALIEEQGLSTEWDGEAFTVRDLPESAALHLMAHEVAWGRFKALEAFCVKNALPFSRWSGAYPSQWGAERVVFSGSGELQSYAADEDDYILIGRCTAERLGSFAAIVAHFDAADFAVPPLVIG
jgi:hypothetical protein